MGEKLISAVVVWFVANFVARLLLGSGPVGTLFGFILGIAAAVWAYRSDLNLVTKLRGRSNDNTAIVQAGANEIVVFQQTVDRPAFFKEIYARGVPPFNILSFWEGRSGQTVEGVIRVANDNELWQRRMLESLWESARYLRAERGYPIRDRLNNVIWPELLDQGILIEIVDNDDGSKSAILAVGVEGSFSRHDWAKAQAGGFGNFKSAWQDYPRAKAKTYGSQTGRSFNVETSEMPLFHLKLKEIVIPGVGKSDPLARSDGGVAFSFPEEWR